MTKQQELEANFKALKAKEAVEKEQAEIDSILSQLGEDLESSPEFVNVDKFYLGGYDDNEKFFKDCFVDRSLKRAKYFTDLGYDVVFSQKRNCWSMIGNECTVFIPKTQRVVGAYNAKPFNKESLKTLVEELLKKKEERNKESQKYNDLRALEDAKFWNKVKNFFK